MALSKERKGVKLTLITSLRSYHQLLRICAGSVRQLSYDLSSLLPGQCHVFTGAKLVESQSALTHTSFREIS